MITYLEPATYTIANLEELEMNLREICQRYQGTMIDNSQRIQSEIKQQLIVELRVAYDCGVIDQIPPVYVSIDSIGGRLSIQIGEKDY